MNLAAADNKSELRYGLNARPVNLITCANFQQAGYHPSHDK